MFDPWAITHERGIEVIRLPLCHLSGYADGRRIWLDQHLTATEARCTLTHELIHLARGHNHHQPPTVEDRVRADTARLLVPWAAITAGEAKFSLAMSSKWLCCRSSSLLISPAISGSPCRRAWGDRMVGSVTGDAEKGTWAVLES